MTTPVIFMAMTVTIEGVEQLRRRIGIVLSRDRRIAMAEHMGQYVLEKTKDHLDEMSVTRHKVADRLGARYTRYLEYASGRAGGTNQNTVMKDVTESGVTISIQNTPGLRRAFGPMTITPKRARALTIPLHRISYGKRVADLRTEGREIVRMGRSNVLGEKLRAKETYTDENGKRRKRNKMRPLYCLVKKVTVPQDLGLLPNRHDYRAWGRKAIGGFLRAEAV